jgi:protoheme IX farnesyltransferase
MSVALRSVFDLFKLRIGLVIGLTALSGLVITPGASVTPLRAFALVLAVSLASAAAGAYNQMSEHALDQAMARTRGRLFATGRLRAGPMWLASILAIGAAGIALAAWAFNPATALYTFLGAFTYAVVYTRWLKMRTAWNIVIGGLAGSFAVMAGGAAVASPGLHPLTLLFALVLFLWTPPHFWSLAIAYRDEYAAAGVPMLPVVVGEARAARVVFHGALLLCACALLPAAFGMGTIYLACATGAGIFLLARTRRLARAPSRATAMASFAASLVYLGVLMAAAAADALLRS